MVERGNELNAKRSPVDQIASNARNLHDYPKSTLRISPRSARASTPGNVPLTSEVTSLKRLRFDFAYESTHVSSVESGLLELDWEARSVEEICVCTSSWA